MSSLNFSFSVSIRVYKLRLYTLRLLTQNVSHGSYPHNFQSALVIKLGSPAQGALSQGN